MYIQVNTHYTEWAYGQIYILQNTPTSWYTIYEMSLHQISILWNTHTCKYTFYGMSLRTNKPINTCYEQGFIHMNFCLHAWTLTDTCHKKNAT